SRLFAQTTVFTVAEESANVHKMPSTGSAVIGQAARGTVVEVTRELGSWVKISWPGAPDGAAYMHTSWGTISQRPSTDQTRTVAAVSPRSELDIASSPNANVRTERTSATASSARASSLGTVYVVPPTHALGLGGRIGGSTLGMGGTIRAWHRDRLGLQLQ